MTQAISIICEQLIKTKTWQTASFKNGFDKVALHCKGNITENINAQN